MNIKPALMGLLRIVLYALPLFFAAQIIFFDASLSLEHHKYSESSYTEWMQVTCLLLTSVLFLWSGMVQKERKALAFLMSGGALMATIREFDWWFDLLYHGAWFPFAMLVLLLIIWGVYKNWDQFMPSLDKFFQTRASGTFLTGAVIVLVFSRLFGRKIVWRAMFEVEKLDTIQRGVKNASEEGVELLGYVILLISAVEYLLYVYRAKKQEIDLVGSKEN